MNEPRRLSGLIQCGDLNLCLAEIQVHLPPSVTLDPDTDRSPNPEEIGFGDIGMAGVTGLEPAT